MKNHNLIIYELDELYKIFLEINNDINLNFRKANKQDLFKISAKLNCLIFTKKKYQESIIK